ncbi:MAG: malto-oligosyltrehalose trehalohydrolase [Actinomycetota bacterium]
MHRHAVWAPQAQHVSLVTAPDTDGQTVEPLTQSAGGWWRHDGPGSSHGTDYFFIIDDGPPTPDPRSCWQPYGVHHASRVFDAQQHTWADHDWRGPRGGAGMTGGVLYELHIGTFTPHGTFDAAIERLNHLVNLGVDAVEIMPVASFDGRWGWGYDGVHPRAVHEPYGGPIAFQRFVDACHQRGLGVCLDVVYNHLGPSGNYLSRYGPYFTDRYETPWGPGLNLDGVGSLAVRRWLIDGALRWFRDFHVDALRLDAVHELKDRSETHVLVQLAEETQVLAAALGRPLELIAESDLNDPRMIEPTAHEGVGINAQWADDVHHAIHAALTGERQGYYVDFGSLPVLAHVLTRVFRHDGCWSTFREHHWGHPVDPAKHHGHQFVVALQTHDQIGNRARGDRFGHLVTAGQQAIGAALILTSAFTPMLFMGEEWQASTRWQYFTDFPDQELGRLVTQGRQREFSRHGWGLEVPDPQDTATRDRSVLRWEELQHGNHTRMLRWYHDLIALRRKRSELANSDLTTIDVQYDVDQEWIVIHRDTLRVVVNLSATAQDIPLTEEPTDVLLCWDPATTSLRDKAVHLGPHTTAIVAT